MKHAQKMLMVPEQLLQSMETEHRLTAPAQLTTLMDSSLPEDQKVLMLDQLLRRYQGLTKQMKNETTVKPAMVLPTPEQPPPSTTSSESEAKTTKVSRTLPVTPVTTKGSKLPKE